MKKYNIFAGNFGSGKTEISVNTALFGAKKYGSAMLVDMDLINPYFKSSSQKELLSENGVELVSPGFAGTQYDTPSLSPRMYSAFDSDKKFLVFDSGGDPDGATVLGILAERFRKVWDETEFFMVINAKRPMQETPEDIIDLLHEIEDCSRMKITALINNTNLAKATDRQCLIEGAEIVREVSKRTGLPIRYHALMPELIEENKDVLYDAEILPVTLHLRPEWFDLFA